MSYEPDRDGWGRPIIGGQPMLRPSSLAKVLSDDFGLTRWKLRQVVWQAARSEDLLHLASTMDATKDSRQLDKIASDLMDRAGSASRANTGTALHSLVEQINRGFDPEVYPALTDDIAAYRRQMARLGVVWAPEWAEIFLVNEEGGYAGTADGLVELPDGRTVVADLKTGRRIYPNEHAIQLALYAHATYGILEGGERVELPDELDPSTGAIVHLPAGEARCDVYLTDLTAGWEAAETALWVYDWRRRKNLAELLDAPAGADSAEPPRGSSPPPDAEPPGSAGSLRDALTRRLDWWREGDRGRALATDWPDNIPPPRAADGWTDDQIEQIWGHLDAVGKNAGEPLTPKPAAPTTPKPIGDPLPAEPRIGGDQLDTLRAAADALPGDARVMLLGWATQAADAGLPMSLRRPTVTERTYCAAACMIAAAQLDDDTRDKFLGIDWAHYGIRLASMTTDDIAQEMTDLTMGPIRVHEQQETA